MKDGKTHIGFVIHTLNPGGTERLAVDMAKALAGEFAVSVMCLDEPGAWAGELREDGIPVTCLWRQPGFDVSAAAAIARFCKSQQVDIIHAHQCTPWFYSALARLFYRKPRLLLEEHGRFYPEADKPLRRLVNRWLIRKLTHRFVAVSADIRERLVRYEGLDEEQIEIIYNGVKSYSQLPSRKRLELRKSLGFDDSDFVVGTVGRADPIKNLPMFVKSVSAELDGCPDLAGLVVGDGPELQATAELVRSLGAERRIHLAGYRSDARDIVQCMQLFVLCSFSEGTSMAVLEAMAAGVPVAVTRVGGNPEIVAHGETGWLVESDDAQALSAIIARAYGSRRDIREIGSAGSRHVERKFGFDGMVARYAQIYRDMIPQSPA